MLTELAAWLSDTGGVLLACVEKGNGALPAVWYWAILGGADAVGRGRLCFGDEMLVFVVTVT